MFNGLEGWQFEPASWMLLGLHVCFSPTHPLFCCFPSQQYVHLPRSKRSMLLWHSKRWHLSVRSNRSLTSLQTCCTWNIQAVDQLEDLLHEKSRAVRLPEAFNRSTGTSLELHIVGLPSILIDSLRPCCKPQLRSPSTVCSITSAMLKTIRRVFGSPKPACPDYTGKSGLTYSFKKLIQRRPETGSVWIATYVTI